jgi:hypothetical protein
MPQPHRVKLQITCQCLRLVKFFKTISGQSYYCIDCCRMHVK